MTDCCRKCMKKFCEQRNTIENCPKCISEVYLSLKEINKKLKDNYNKCNS